MAAYDITTAAASLEFETGTNLYNACVKIDDNHVINVWYNFNGTAQVFEINTTTWAVTTAAAALVYDAVGSQYNSISMIDANHAIVFRSGSSNHGFTNVLEINTTTWAVTTASAVLEFDASLGRYGDSFKIDTNHFINFWAGSGNDGYAQTFEVNTTTWAVTTAAAPLEFDTQLALWNSCYQIDDNHFINFWSDIGGDGIAQVFEVNTTTWAVTTAAALLEFDVNDGDYNECFKIDTNHFINFWAGVDGDGFVQTFEVNTTTWVVTTAAAPLEFDTQLNLWNSCYQADENHFINFWSGNGNDGYAQTFEVNTTTWAVTTAAAPLEFDTQDCTHNSCAEIDSGYFINFWAGVDGDGFVQMFDANVPTVVYVDGAAALSAAGTIVAAGDIMIDGAAALSAAGTIVAAGDIMIDGAAALSGAATITATGDIMVDGAATLSVVGTVTVLGLDYDAYVVNATSDIGASTLTFNSYITQ